MMKSFFPCVQGLLALSLLGLAGCYSEVELADSSAEKAITIDWVEPPCAEPGSPAGYIEGNGFGAENVTVTVGGIEAEVLTATGMDASFVVPEGIPPGPIEVVVENPGGRIATIQWVSCDRLVFPCTEQGIRYAIAQGGGPLTFACDGPTVVQTQAEIVIDNDVILDGEGDLTVSSGYFGRVFQVAAGTTAGLHNMTIADGSCPDAFSPGLGILNLGTLEVTNCVITGGGRFVGPDPLCQTGGGIKNEGTMSLTDSIVSNNVVGTNGAGISSNGTMTLVRSRVTGNRASSINAGISFGGNMTLIDSTVSGNLGGSAPAVSGGGGTLLLVRSTVSGNGCGPSPSLPCGIGHSSGVATIINSTISQNSSWTAPQVISNSLATVQLISSTVQNGQALLRGTGITATNTALVRSEIGPSFASTCTDPVTSGGGNIETLGDTCGLTAPTDQVNVSTAALNLGPLQDNGGPTETHALGAGSVAIDAIPEAECEVETDQRGEPRPVVIVGPESCDVGAFEVQP